VADLRAESGLVRVGLDMLADEVDFKDFSLKVMARITPERPPLWERLKVSASELFTYKGPVLAGGFAMAALALVLGLAFTMRAGAPTGYGAPEVAVEAVSTDEGAHVAPVVMKTDEGTIIWLVDHEDKPGLNVAPDSGKPAGAPEEHNAPAAPQRPNGGEL
jgi:hypothetical protein